MRGTSWAPLALSLGLCLLKTSSATQFGAWATDLQGRNLALAKAELIAGCILSAASACFLIAAWLQIAGQFVPRRWCGDFCHPAKHAVLTVFWLPIIAISAYLLSRHHIPSVAFLVSGVVLAVAHAATATAQLCGCCGAANLWGTSADHPKSALLTSPNGFPHQTAVGSAGGGSTSGGGAAGHGAAAVSSTACYPAGRNPFYATYGLLPGSSSVFAYQIFIPGTDEEQAAAAGACNYTGLRSGPNRERRGDRAARGPILQPLSPMQELSSQELSSHPMAAALAAARA